MARPSILQILIEARNNARGELDDLDKQLGALDYSAARAGRSVAAAGAIFGAFQLAKQIGQLGEMSAQSMRVAESFGQLANSVGESSDSMLASLRKASRGTIDDTSLMLTANQAMLLGVAKNADDMANLLEVAAARGRATGRTTQQAFDDIVVGIGRMSPKILDNLGIMLDSERVFGDYAESIGKAAEALTDAEKKTALVNAVIADSADLLKSAKESADDATSSFERLSASTSNLKDAIGQTIAPGVALWAEFFAFIADTGTSAFTTIGRAIGSIPQPVNEGTAALANYYLEITKAADATDDFSEAEGRSVGELARAKTAIENILGPLRELRDIQEDVAGALRSSATGSLVGAVGAEKALGIYQSQKKILDEQVAAWEAQGIQGDELVFRAAELENRLLGVQRALVSATEETAKTTSNVQATNKEYDALKSKIEGILGTSLDSGIDLDSILPRPDAINEDARRLADVAVNGFESPWYEFLRNKFPGLFDAVDAGADVKEFAGRVLRDFEAGLVPKLLDKDTAKERVRNLLIGEHNIGQLANEIAQELSQEMGIPLSQVQSKAFAALGAPQDTGAIAGGMVEAVGNEDIGGQVVDKIKFQLNSDASLGKLRESAQRMGQVWGGAFLQTVGENVPGALIDILANLVTPIVQSNLLNSATAQGAN